MTRSGARGVHAVSTGAHEETCTETPQAHVFDACDRTFGAVRTFEREHNLQMIQRSQPPIKKSHEKSQKYATLQAHS